MATGHSVSSVTFVSSVTLSAASRTSSGSQKPDPAAPSSGELQHVKLVICATTIVEPATRSAHPSLVLFRDAYRRQHISDCRIALSWAMPAHWKGEFPAAHPYLRPLLEGTWKILCLIAWGTPPLELRWASVRAETEEEHTQYLDGISKRLQTTTLVASLQVLLVSNAVLLTTEPPLSGQIVNYTAHGPYICL
ncbi:hypothetical protein EXIGLDRAFT_832569 [Exidia glandulosa HHB12029]|uniref:Uncharacterized protein n=1 Tax=Exidia glandulosa HHB12029 TaxID=1314781 RepID=A0A165LGL4_EXIGL|nr:hypothetical protein EXIGLDRAFT_832569 [Exidia glandulosa HHB12029]